MKDQIFSLLPHFLKKYAIGAILVMVFLALPLVIPPMSEDSYLLMLTNAFVGPIGLLLLAAVVSCPEVLDGELLPTLASKVLFLGGILLGAGSLEGVLLALLNFGLGMFAVLILLLNNTEWLSWPFYGLRFFQKTLAVFLTDIGLFLLVRPRLRFFDEFKPVLMLISGSSLAVGFLVLDMFGIWNRIYPDRWSEISIWYFLWSFVPAFALVDTIAVALLRKQHVAKALQGG